MTQFVEQTHLVISTGPLVIPVDGLVISTGPLVISVDGLVNPTTSRKPLEKEKASSRKPLLWLIYANF